MAYLRIILILAVALPLSGCLTFSPRYEEWVASSITPASGKGRVYVYRPGLLPLFGGAYDIYVNEVYLPATIGPREFIAMDPPAGSITLRIQGGAVVEFVLEKGEVVYIRIAVSHQLFGPPREYPQVVEASVGRSEIKGHRLSAEFWVRSE